MPRLVLSGLRGSTGVDECAGSTWSRHDQGDSVQCMTAEAGLCESTSAHGLGQDIHARLAISAETEPVIGRCPLDDHVRNIRCGTASRKAAVDALYRHDDMMVAH